MRHVRCAACAALAFTTMMGRAVTVEFNRDVRPILSENCFVCHGPGKEDRKANLRLDLREVALEHKAIIPGDPAKSKIIQHVFSTDPKAIMPPPESNKKLSAAEKQTLRDWIAAGAKYEPFWAYVKPMRAEAPPVRDPAWGRNPIDAFVLHKLEEKHLKPSSEADKATLLRRLSLDLVGLPPTPDEVAAFVSDPRPDSYERQVERLLASPHFGERMAVPWLDVVRFADTVGYHGDQNINIFPYRDYVIEAYNTNKPFDQFTIEQLAGDLLPNPTTESRIATGFNRLNMVTREGGAQPKEYLAKYASDRVRTVSMTWLGSTMGCAECHDHKYDPFTSKDFYQMEAFFADIQQWGVYADYGYNKIKELKGISNDDPFPPQIEVDSPYLLRRIKNLSTEIHSLYGKAMNQLREQPAAGNNFKLWRDTSLAFLQQHPDGWATPPPQVHIQPEKAEAKTNVTIEADGTIQLPDAPRKKVEIELPLSGQHVAALRLELVVHEPNKDADGSPKPVTVTLSATVKSGSEQTKLAFVAADADHKRERYSNGFPVVGITGGWLLPTGAGLWTGVWVLDKPLDAKDGDFLLLDVGALPVGSIRASVTPFAAAQPLDCGQGKELIAALDNASPDSTAPFDLASSTYLLSTLWNAELAGGVRKVQKEVDQCRHGRAFTLVTVARPEPRVTRILPRGDWQDDSGETVQPGVPHFLPQPANPDARRLNRLDLAHWLISPENPLMARTVMNRLWKQFFGTGISAVVDDLGGQGEWPTHPELLDWLACEFMHPQCHAGAADAPPHDWDIKHMVRLIVMSSTYRQAARGRPDLKEIDPNNRLLARQSPRRLEAEFVRDNALSICGLLDLDLGGPSVHPYQPAGYYANLQFPDRDYVADQDDRQYRRGIYMHWQRTFLHPMLANFDAPSREECVAARVVSNTPQQALTLLDDPTFVEASRAWAQRLLRRPGDSDTARLDRAFHRALARAPTAKENESLLQFLAHQRAYYQEKIDDAAKLLKIGLVPAPADENPAEVAAWTQVCRVILNLHETITCY